MIAAWTDFVNLHFLRNKIEDAGLKLFGSKLRALSGAERRVLDTVLIHNTAPRLSSPFNFGPSQFVALFSLRQNTRFVVRAEEKLTAFLELEAAVRTCGELA
jgi:hypothetical protein